MIRIQPTRTCMKYAWHTGTLKPPAEEDVMTPCYRPFRWFVPLLFWYYVLLLVLLPVPVFLCRYTHTILLLIVVSYMIPVFAVVPAVPLPKSCYLPRST